MNFTQEQFFDTRIKFCFLYYDRPLFYISETALGEFHLHYEIEEDRENNKELLFVAPITREEIGSLLQMKLEVKRLLQDKISLGEMYYAHILYEEKKSVQFVQVTPENLDPEALPDERFYVEFDTISNEYTPKIKWEKTKE